MDSEHVGDGHTCEMAVAIASMHHCRPGNRAGQAFFAEPLCSVKCCAWTQEAEVMQRLDYRNARASACNVDRGREARKEIVNVDNVRLEILDACPHFVCIAERINTLQGGLCGRDQACDRVVVLFPELNRVSGARQKRGLRL